MEAIKYKIDKSTVEDIFLHLNTCDLDYIPKLSLKVNIDEYSQKLFQNANRFEAWNNNKLIGLLAIYFNFEENFAFITNVSIFKRLCRKRNCKKDFRNGD